MDSLVCSSNVGMGFEKAFTVGLITEVWRNGGKKITAVVVLKFGVRTRKEEEGVSNGSRCSRTRVGRKRRCSGEWL